jgi:hypothetical protein
MNKTRITALLLAACCSLGAQAQTGPAASTPAKATAKNIIFFLGPYTFRMQHGPTLKSVYCHILFNTIDGKILVFMLLYG